jgi:hypothetical protein
MKKMFKIKCLNKKASIGEAIQDLSAFLLVFFILILLIIFSAVFHKELGKSIESKIDEKILHDQINSYVLTALMEKQDDLSLSELIRNKDSTAKEKLEKGVQEICDEEARSYGCHVSIIYKDAIMECQKKPEKATQYFCFFIPAQEPIAIKIITVWGYKI